MMSSTPVRITKIENFGRKITLSDNSEWEVFFLDTVKSSRWIPHNMVVMRKKEYTDIWSELASAPYPYTTILEYVDSGRTVSAKRIN